MINAILYAICILFIYQILLEKFKANQRKTRQFTTPTNILKRGKCVNSRNGEIIAPINQPAETVIKKSESLFFWRESNFNSTLLYYHNFYPLKKVPVNFLELRWPGNDLFSRSVARQLSLALVRFTTVFEMVTGGSIPLKLPSHHNFKRATSEQTSFVLSKPKRKASRKLIRKMFFINQFVLVSLTLYSASTPSRST